jgi:lysophospholipase L1-like esterase
MALLLLGALGILRSACSTELKSPATLPDFRQAGFPDPRRLESEIRTFEEQDASHPPPRRAIVGIGSSSMRLWHQTIQEDLAPLRIIPRGFGGSTMYDALFYADRIVIPCQPRAVLLYEGDNDIAHGVPPEQVLLAFEAFVEKLRAMLPNLRIYVLSIKPSIARWEFWPAMQSANRHLWATCQQDSLLFYIDAASPMLDKEGRPERSLFLPDMLHMNEKGYAIWRAAVRAVLLPHELSYEARARIKQ